MSRKFNWKVIIGSVVLLVVLTCGVDFIWETNKTNDLKREETAASIALIKLQMQAVSEQREAEKKANQRLEEEINAENKFRTAIEKNFATVFETYMKTSNDTAGTLESIQSEFADLESAMDIFIGMGSTVPEKYKKEYAELLIKMRKVDGVMATAKLQADEKNVAQSALTLKGGQKYFLDMREILDTI
jgi:hypothetical protein